MKGDYDAEDYSVAAQFSLRLEKKFGLYDNFGSRIAWENIVQGKWHDYDCFWLMGMRIRRNMMG